MEIARRQPSMAPTVRTIVGERGASTVPSWERFHMFPDEINSFAVVTENNSIFTEINPAFN
jgi:hypothetical protein